MIFILCLFVFSDCIIITVMNMDLKHKDKYTMLGLNIAYYRKLNGYTQEKLADKLNLDRTTISKIELATCGASLDTIFAIADLLDISVDKLFVFRN